MRVIIAVLGAALLVLLLTADAVAIGVSVVFAGMLGPGISAVMLGRVGQIAGGEAAARQRGWTQATIAWAVGQAAGAYGLAWLYGEFGGYNMMFAAALVALAVAAAMEVVVALQPTWRVGWPHLTPAKR